MPGPVVGNNPATFGGLRSLSACVLSVEKRQAPQAVGSESIAVDRYGRVEVHGVERRSYASRVRLQVDSLTCPHGVRTACIGGARQIGHSTGRRPLQHPLVRGRGVPG